MHSCPTRPESAPSVVAARPDDAEARHLGEVDDQRRTRDRRVGAGGSLDPRDARGHFTQPEPDPRGATSTPDPGEPLLGAREDRGRVRMSAVEPLRLAAQRVGEPLRASLSAAECSVSSRRCVRPDPHRSPSAPASNETGPSAAKSSS